LVLAAGLLSLLALAGCQGYAPQALNRAPPQWMPMDRLVVDTHALRLPELPPHPFDPSDGLDIVEVAMLAVSNNSDLQLARADLKLVHAQAFAAGLLPDPQLALTADTPRPRQPGLTNPFNVGINFDFGALIAASAKTSAAAADVEKTDLALLWQEWQVASQARQLFVKQRSLERLARVIRGMFDAQARRLDLAEAALREGNVSADAVGPYLLAREDWRKQVADTGRQLNQTRHDLAALLGLAPDARLDLVGPAEAPPVDDAQIAQALAHLSQRRPDLVALEAGYRGQDEKFRAAILAQFPAITLGPTRARDSSGIYTTGLAASISLPIFNRNRGNIAIEHATRDKLRQEYDARLRAAYADVDRLLSDQRLLETQWRDAAASLPELEKLVERGSAALDARQITISSFVDLQGALAARQIETLGLEQGVWTQRIALLALLGNELPAPRPQDPKTP
jgi:outer membrane protein TolC